MHLQDRAIQRQAVAIQHQALAIPLLPHTPAVRVIRPQFQVRATRHLHRAHLQEHQAMPHTNPSNQLSLHPIQADHLVYQ